jgi:hypothetical protein
MNESQEYKRHGVAGLESEPYPVNKPEVLFEDDGQLLRDVPEMLEENDERRMRFDITLKNGKLKDEEEYPNFCINTIKIILEHENVEDGTIAVVVSRSAGPAPYADDWHVDGREIYLYSNKNPTQILYPEDGHAYTPNPSGRPSGTVRSGDVRQLPVNALVKVPENLFHRRDPEAINDPGRIIMRVTVPSDRFY